MFGEEVFTEKIIKIILFLLISLLIFGLPLFIYLNGFFYKPICEDLGITSIWRCGWIAPDFIHKINVNLDDCIPQK